MKNIDGKLNENDSGLHVVNKLINPLQRCTAVRQQTVIVSDFVLFYEYTMLS